MWASAPTRNFVLRTCVAGNRRRVFSQLRVCHRKRREASAVSLGTTTINSLTKLSKSTAHLLSLSSSQTEPIVKLNFHISTSHWNLVYSILQRWRATGNLLSTSNLATPEFKTSGVTLRLSIATANFAKTFTSCIEDDHLVVANPLKITYNSSF